MDMNVKESPSRGPGSPKVVGPYEPDTGRNFSQLLSEGETFKIGNLDALVMLSPGHTLGSVSYVIGDTIFAQDTFMQPDAGAVRANFPGGSAAGVHDSLMAILDHSDDHPSSSVTTTAPRTMTNQPGKAL